MSDKKQVKLIMEVNKEDCDVVTTVTEKIVSAALGYTPMDAALKGAKLGVSELDTNGKVVSSQLPSFVDDVIEGYLYNGQFYKESAHTTKITGETGKIYIDLSTEKTYRWSGSVYTVISDTLALGETSSTAYRGDRGKIAYDHSQAVHAPSNAEKNQNAFANVKVGSTTIAADNASDVLTLVSGDNVTITADTSTDTLTISSHDSTYSSAGTALGLVKSGGDVTISSGLITVNDDSHNHVIANVDGLQTALDGKAPSSHSHNYAGSSSAGGAATSANKLNTNAGSATQPVYFSNGVPVKTTYTLGKSVPSDAVFKDTWRGIQNNLTSTSTTDSLSAAQGKILNEKFSNYLPLGGGSVVYTSNFDDAESVDVTVTNLFNYGLLQVDILIKHGMTGTYVQGIIATKYIENTKQQNIRLFGAPGKDTMTDFIAIKKGSSANTITFETHFTAYSGYGISSIKITSI